MSATPRFLIVLTLATGCAAPKPKLDIKLTPSSQLCAGAPPPAGAMCLPTDKLEHLLKESEMSVLQVRSTSSGTNGAVTMWLEFPKEGVTLKAKWKEAARGGSALNNQPRKELAAYELQKLFLAPDEYVVPPTESRCIPLEKYQSAVRPTKPTFDGTSCAFGVLAYWLEGVKGMGKLDRTKFETDLNYRKTMANLNLFTYLFNHRDTRSANFVMARSNDYPRAFSIDNGLALDGLMNPETAFLHEWSRIVVPKLPYRTIDRLRKVTRAQLDTLGTVAEFAIDSKQLEPIDNTAAFVEKDGIRRRGNVIQLGLTKREIDQIEGRIQDLLRKVDAKEIEQY